jgi:hypothetical protein
MTLFISGQYKFNKEFITIIGCHLRHNDFALNYYFGKRRWKQKKQESTGKDGMVGK